MKYDVIIIGAGVAGLSVARYLDKKLNTLILCKEEPWDCNTFFAQGGISFPRDENDIDSHISDTIKAGANHNEIEAVKLLSNEALPILKDLLDSGFMFDLLDSGALDYAKEGGHSIARILHTGGDATGRVLHSFLLSVLTHTLHKSALVIDLLIEENRIYGVVVKTKNERKIFYADNVVIASGGVGGLFMYHTNAWSISGDLHGIICEKNLALKDMEMLQFHPTAYIDSSGARKTLITEALRGEGAKIIDSNNERFLFKYDKRGELAPRDIVARAIYRERFINKNEVFLDASNFSLKDFQSRFPNVYRSLKNFKLDIPKQKIPIAPAFHYSMGGIEVSLNGRVKNMENLYALGECARNGVHGANRLASNSLLEGLVFGKIVARSIMGSTKTNSLRNFPITNKDLHKDGDLNLKNYLRKIMWENVGIMRTNESLNLAKIAIESMKEANIGRMLDLRLNVAMEIIKQARARKTSLGAHFISDTESSF